MPYDPRYKPTPQDVLDALTPKERDPFGINNEPHTEFTIATTIKENRKLGQGALGKVLQRNTLSSLLEEMAVQGRLVRKTTAKWAALLEWAPTRSTIPLYTTPERAEAWGITNVLNKDRWTLHVEFDDLTVQASDPELGSPNDESSQFRAYMLTRWTMTPEDLADIVQSTATHVRVELEGLEMAGDLMLWLSYNTVPKRVHLARNEPRS